ncbi:MAG: flavin reductase family protein [Nitrosopumilaceae archaeon]
MERKVAKDAQKYFVTGVSMITSTGPLRDNVMAAEWTMQISYDPLLIAVFIHPSAATFKNIKKTKEFGVNVAAEGQTSLVNISGGYSRIEIDKLKVRDSFNLLKPRYIKAPLISGCIINAECKLVTMKKLGDHTMVVGKVVAIRYDKTKTPLVYHTSKYHRIGSVIEPFRQVVSVNRMTFEWFFAQADGRFVLKCLGALIKSDKRILISNYTTKNGPYMTIPYTVPKRGSDHAKALQVYLKQSGLKAELKHIPIIKRLVVKNKSRIQRINFILFEGKLRSKPVNQNKWKSVRTDALLQAITS